MDARFFGGKGRGFKISCSENPTLPESVASALDDAITASGAKSSEQLQKLEIVLQAFRREMMGSQPGMSGPCRVALAFLDYACQAGLKLRCDFEERK